MRLVLVVAALVAAGCGAQQAQGPEPCRFAGTIGGLSRWGCVAHGDVDGDGRADDVTIAHRGDRFSLVVRTRGRVTTAAVTTPVQASTPPMIAMHMGGPQVTELVDLPGLRAFQALVVTATGASVAAIVLYAWRGGRPVAIVRRGDGGTVWEDGGTVGTGSTASDCVRWHGRRYIGVLHVGGATLGDRGAYDETLYRLRGATAVPVRTWRARGRPALGDPPRSWPHVRGGFESCGGVRTDFRGLPPDTTG